MREFLIDPKRDPEQEYTIHLFEFCNLSCSFCWQNHQDKIEVDIKSYERRMDSIKDEIQRLEHDKRLIDEKIIESKITTRRLPGPLQGKISSSHNKYIKYKIKYINLKNKLLLLN